MNLNDRLSALGKSTARPLEGDRMTRDGHRAQQPTRRAQRVGSRPTGRERRRCHRPESLRCSSRRRLAPREPAGAVDPLAAVKERAAEELFGRIGSRLNDATLTEEQLHSLARAELAEIVAGEQLALSTAERNRLIDDIGADVLGYGPLEPLLADPPSARSWSIASTSSTSNATGGLKGPRTVSPASRSCGGSSSASSPGSDDASTSPRRSSTHDSKTDPASTRSSRRSPSTVRR